MQGSQEISDSVQSNSKISKQKQENTLKQISIIKRSKIANYPYYPVSHALTQNGVGYVFSLDVLEQPTLAINPYMEDPTKKGEYISLMSNTLALECLPRKNVNFLYILEYEDVMSANKRSTVIKYIDFVVGFSAGLLIRCKYRNSINPSEKTRKMEFNKRQLAITGRFNRKPNHKQGMLTKMNNKLFGNEQLYKVAIQKPVRNFAYHQDINKSKIQKYRYSYLIGNRLYLCTQFTEEIQYQILMAFQLVQWDKMPIDTMRKLFHPAGVIINSKRHKTIITQKSMLIQWADQIPCYIYNSENQLIIADNEENKITIYNVLDNLRIKKVYSFDLDIKKMNYFVNSSLGKPEVFLLIMPYDLNLYILNLDQNTAVAVMGHRSYITQSVLTDSGFIITGGCDQRVGFCNIKTIKEWSKISFIKGSQSPNTSKFYEILTSKVARTKMNEVYFYGVFNNINSERNNNNEFGFGNFLSFGKDSELYAFMAFDFFVKVYRIKV